MEMLILLLALAGIVVFEVFALQLVGAREAEALREKQSRSRKDEESVGNRMAIKFIAFVAAILLIAVAAL